MNETWTGGFPYELSHVADHLLQLADDSLPRSDPLDVGRLLGELGLEAQATGCVLLCFLVFRFKFQRLWPALFSHKLLPERGSCQRRAQLWGKQPEATAEKLLSTLTLSHACES